MSDEVEVVVVMMITVGPEGDRHIGLEAGPVLAERPTRTAAMVTAREKEVQLAVTRGSTNGEIADNMYISLSTVKAHIGALMRKLDARVA